MKYLAAINIGSFSGPGPLGKPTDATAPTMFSTLISGIIGVMTAIAFIWFVFQFFTAAISWISAGGDKNKVAEARSQITTSVIGLVVVISAIFIVGFLGNLLGVNILDIAGLIQTLSP